MVSITAKAKGTNNAPSTKKSSSLLLGVPNNIFWRMIILGGCICTSHLWITRHWNWWEGWVYAGISFLCFVMSRILAERNHPGILRERMNFSRHSNTQNYDKILAPIMALGTMALPIGAGLDHKYNKNHASLVLYWPAVFTFLPVKLLASLAVVAGYTIASYALIENPFFSGVMRIQDDRNRELGQRHYVLSLIHI